MWTVFAVPLPARFIRVCRAQQFGDDTPHPDVMQLKSFWFGVLLVALFGVACVGNVGETAVAPSIQIQMMPLLTPQNCTGQFQVYQLDHITTPQAEPVDMYDSNGAGLAVNDLDNDGDMDIVMANLRDNNNIFWNDGGLTFRREELTHGSSRAVAIVDVDADGWLDIVFTTRVGKGLIYWHNQGVGKFERLTLPGVDQYAYSMAWGDVNKDGDLDLVTASYDTALDKELRDAFMFGTGAGVFYYENQEGTFVGQRLAETSQALAVQLLDVNGDGRSDILIGNDFGTVPDSYWLQTAWQLAEPFTNTSQNTMSFDVGDVDNNGRLDLFAADMHPYSDDPATMAAWQSVMESMVEPLPGDRQIMANMLQMGDAAGNFVNVAEGWGAAYTGWSWSSKFGDLDQDGLLDLYSVNGMMTASTFSHLPGFELVEENQVLRNGGNGRFLPQPDWHLNQTAGGRGMSMADLDGDGDLDIIINNLLSPATILENQLCQGNSLLVDLRWPDTANPYAIGTTVTLQTSAGFHMRDVRVSSGYLSGDPSQLHFGFPAGGQPFGLIITWPDGILSHVFDIQPNQKLIITRGK